ncbi:hypothetical protein D3C80_1651070 [compost metagenome]
MFRPRLQNAFPQLGPVVFAIDQENAVHYYLPRECPRVIYWKASGSSDEDVQRFFADSEASKIIIVENNWLKRIREMTLYRYSFAEESFELLEEAKTAGYYISRDEITPIKTEPVDDLLGNIVAQNVELRFTPDLHRVRDRVIASTLDFSIIRFRNAQIAT